MKKILIAFLLVLSFNGFTQNIDSLNNEFLKLKTDFYKTKNAIQLSNDLHIQAENYSNIALGSAVVTGVLTSFLFISGDFDEIGVAAIGGAGALVSISFYTLSKIKRNKAYGILYNDF